MRAAGIIIESSDGKRRAIVKPVRSKDRTVEIQLGPFVIHNAPAMDVVMELYDITASKQGRLIKMQRVESLGFPEVRLMMRAIEPDIMGDPSEDEMLLFVKRFLAVVL